MLYQIYETQRALMAPFADFAGASAKLYSHPLSPFTLLPLAGRLSAAFELAYRLGKDYEKPEFGITSVRTAGVDVAAYLERHGIRASFSTTPRQLSVSVGATLLNRVTDVHADLLVMGLYSHARMHERVLGGATRTILETMTVPVLLSH